MKTVSLKTAILISLLVGLPILFQNCSNPKFVASGDSSSLFGSDGAGTSTTQSSTGALSAPQETSLAPRSVPAEY